MFIPGQLRPEREYIPVGGAVVSSSAVTPEVALSYGEIDYSLELRMDATGALYERHWQPLDIADIRGYGEIAVRTSPLSITFEYEEAMVTTPRLLQRQEPFWEAVHTFRRALQAVEGVEAILADRQSEGLSISVIVNNATRERCYEVYDHEWQLMQRYPELGFDFHFIDRHDRPLSEVVSIEFSDLYLRV